MAQTVAETNKQVANVHHAFAPFLERVVGIIPHG
jgi:hypothetical protein